MGYSRLPATVYQKTIFDACILYRCRVTWRWKYRDLKILVGSLKIIENGTIRKLGMVSYSHSIVTMAVSVAVSTQSINATVTARQQSPRFQPGCSRRRKHRPTFAEVRPKIRVVCFCKDGKEPSLLKFGSVQILPKVRFGSVRVLCKHGKFQFGSGSVLVVSVLSSVGFGSVWVRTFDSFNFTSLTTQTLTTKLWNGILQYLIQNQRI